MLCVLLLEFHTHWLAPDLIPYRVHPTDQPVKNGRCFSHLEVLHLHGSDLHLACASPSRLQLAPRPSPRDNTTQHNATLYNAMQCHTTQHNATQHNTTQHKLSKIKGEAQALQDQGRGTNSHYNATQRNTMQHVRFVGMLCMLRAFCVL